MFQSIYVKRTALVLAFIVFGQSIFPSVVLALTSGPSQPEFSGFNTIGVDEIVDHFTGDLNYTLPLFEVPGVGGSYPLNLTYNSEVRPETEASMVGYGWNLNIGQITRDVLGIPDDFNGDYIRSFTDIRPNWTLGVTPVKVDPEVINKNPVFTTDLTFKYNNYNGFGLDLSAGLKFKGSEKTPLSGSFKSTVSTLEGSKWSAGLSLKTRTENFHIPKKAGLSLSGNSLSGLQNVSYNVGSSIPVFEDRYPLSTGPSEFTGRNVLFSLTTGAENTLFSLGSTFAAFYSQQVLKNNGRWVNKPSYGYNNLEGIEDDQEGIADYSKLSQYPILENHKILNGVKCNKDHFHVNANGLSGRISPYRGDVGVFSEPNTQSAIDGVNLGIEFEGGKTGKFGLSLGVPISRTSQHYRGGDLDQHISFKFQGRDTSSLYEPFYYKFSGELTGETSNSITAYNQSYDYIGNDDLVKLKRGGELKFSVPPTSRSLSFARLDSHLVDKDEVSLPGTEGLMIRENRKPRTKNIEHYTNGEILDNTRAYSRQFNTEIIDLTQEGINSFSNHDPAFLESQSMNVGRTFGNTKLSAISIVDEQSTYWNFDLPVLNHIKRDVSFSVPQETQNTCAKDIIPYAGFECDGDIGLKGDILHKQSDVQDLADDSEELLNITETPAHATSFLLTSILGYNYVDTDDNGPDDGDIGHWIKFQYYMKNGQDNPYRWRIPYCGVSYNPGSRLLDEDDKGSFSYGEREQYYIERIETPTHVALFDYVERDDNRGVLCWLNSERAQDSFPSTLALQEIRLMAKSEVNGIVELSPVKRIVLTHDYTIHPGVLNNHNDGGKLTLKELEILNYQSTRGQLNPYVFTYFDTDCCGETPPPPPPGEDPEDPGGNGGVDNPGGEELKYASQGDLSPHLDRWGMKHPCSIGDDECLMYNAPYTRQGLGIDDLEYNKRIDCSARQGHLEAIELPSGAKLSFGVARDHYSRVQNKRAGQMMRITGFGASKASQIPNQPYSQQFNKDAGRVYFELAEPIRTDDELLDIKLANIVSDLYEDERGKQVFFKSYAQYTPQTDFDYVDGYAYLLKDINGDDEIHYDQSSIENGYYTQAYIILEPEDIPTKNGYTRAPIGDYHPFLVVGWQILKNAYSKVLLPSQFEDPADNNAVKSLARRYLGTLKSVLDLVQGFYNSAQTFSYCGNVSLDYSYLRLCSPDNVKYGDGVRITSVMLNDIWSEEETPNLGFIYKYTDEITHDLSDEGGGQITETVSTGVASNEPQIGSEENIYKYVEDYNNNLRNNLTRSLFMESPVHSALLPGAKVGYSKVTVTSLASEYHNVVNQRGHESIFGFNSPMPSLSSTGKSEYAFYTAKDFPAIFRRTILDHAPFSPNLIYLVYGTFNYRGFVGSQGYTIETNDMHGKPKSVASFAQNKDGTYGEYPINKTEYIYQEEKELISDGIHPRAVKKPNNQVDILVSPVRDIDHGNYEADIQPAELGVTRDIVNHIDQITDFNGSLGIEPAIDFDVTMFPVILFAATGWPNVQLSFDKVSTAVTTKCIHRNGIVKEVVVKDAQAEVKSSNDVFDPYTGTPVLKSTNTIYDETQYAYNIPAHHYYANCEPSYFNWGVSFTGSVHRDSIDVCTGAHYVSGVPSDIVNNIRPGDVLAYSGEAVITTMGMQQIMRISDVGVVLQNHTPDTNDLLVDIFDPATFNEIESINFQFKLIKPNRDNLLYNFHQEILSLSDPTEPNLVIPTSSCSGGGEHYQIDSVLSSQVDVFSEFNHTNYMTSMRTATLKLPGNLAGGAPRNTGLLYMKGFLGNLQKIASLSFNKERESDLGSFDTAFIFNPNTTEIHCSSVWDKWTFVGQYEYTPFSVFKKQETKIDGVPYSGIYNYCRAFDVTGADNEDISVAQFQTAQISGGGYMESSFNSFETYEVNYLYENNFSGFTSVPNYSHFDFDNFPKQTNLLEYSVYPIIEHNDNLLTIGKPYPKYDQEPHSLVIYESDSLSSIIYEYLPPSGTSLQSSIYQGLGPFNGKEVCTIPFQDLTGEYCNQFDYTKSRYVSIRHNPSGMFGAPNYDRTEDFSHTGNSSWLLDQNTKFTQTSLDLIHDKQYVFSCWVHSGENITHDLDALSIEVEINGDIPTSAVTIKPAGSRIEGWQRIEGVFTADHNGQGQLTTDVEFKLGSASNLYIDDVRIYPLGAKMESYVYDPRYHRVTHVLDENNYFTEFIYDAEGNLVAINKETEKGIRTIEEQHKFIVPKI